MKISKILILILLLTCIRNSFAVVNTENLRRELDSAGFYNTAEVNIGLRSGNVNFNEVGASYRLDFLTQNTKSFFISSFNYRDNNQTLIDRNGFAHLRFNFLKTKLLKPELFLQAEFDEFRNLNQRYLGGSNLRIDFESNDSTSFFAGFHIAIGTGLMYEEEHIDEGELYISYIWRHNNYLTIDYKLSKTLEIKTVSYIQYDIFSRSDFRVLNESILLFNINKYLQFSFSISYRYDNEPNKGTIHYDSFIRNGIRLNF